MNKNFARPLIAFALLLSFAGYGFADTVRLKDGTVIRGQIVGFRDQQFTVLIGTGERGRRSRIMLYMEDVESIDFDAGDAAASNPAANDATSGATTNTGNTAPPRQQPSSTTTASSRPANSTSQPSAPTSRPSQQPGATGAAFFKVNVRVRADNTTNGWTNSGLVVRRGQRLRISATGRVSLGQSRYSTPSGLPTLQDKGKLMQNEPTGALIAVIGDDNDDFILIGPNHEFTAARDGVLFLGVNESELNDNTGTYDAVIEAEAVSSRASL